MFLLKFNLQYNIPITINNRSTHNNSQFCGFVIRPKEIWDKVVTKCFIRSTWVESKVQAFDSFEKLASVFSARFKWRSKFKFYKGRKRIDKVKKDGGDMINFRTENLHFHWSLGGKRIKLHRFYVGMLICMYPKIFQSRTHFGHKIYLYFLNTWKIPF